MAFRDRKVFGAFEKRVREVDVLKSSRHTMYAHRKFERNRVIKDGVQVVVFQWYIKILRLCLGNYRTLKWFIS